MRVLAKNLRDDNWDCETIVSTYTNTDNHPGLIKDALKPKKNLMKVAKQILVKGFGTMAVES